MEGESNYSNMTNTPYTLSYLQTFWWFWTEWRSGNTALICTIIATLSPLHDWYAHSSNGIVFLFFYIYLFCKASEINSEQRKSAFVWMCSEGINNQQPNVVCVCVCALYGQPFRCMTNAQSNCQHVYCVLCVMPDCASKLFVRTITTNIHANKNAHWFTYHVLLHWGQHIRNGMPYHSNLTPQYISVPYDCDSPRY